MSVKGRAPTIDAQMIHFRPNQSPSGPPRMVPAATARQEHEEIELRRLDAHAELAHQVKRVEARQARQVEVFEKMSAMRMAIDNAIRRGDSAGAARRE